MGRIRLEIPGPLSFSTHMPIRVTDLNYANHLANDSVLSLMHEARVRFFKHHGYTELDAEGVSFIMGDCAVVFKEEGFYGDRLEIEVGAGEFSPVSFDLFYRFKIEGEEKVLVEAKTGLVCFNYDTRRVVKVPEALRNTLGDVSAVPSTRN